jgi:hypothetical protein
MIRYSTGNKHFPAWKSNDWVMASLSCPVLIVGDGIFG